MLSMSLILTMNGKEAHSSRGRGSSIAANALKLWTSEHVVTIPAKRIAVFKKIHAHTAEGSGKPTEGVAGNGGTCTQDFHALCAYLCITAQLTERQSAGGYGIF